jgi:hypothetical protein
MVGRYVVIGVVYLQVDVFMWCPGASSRCSDGQPLEIKGIKLVSQSAPDRPMDTTTV